MLRAEQMNGQVNEQQGMEQLGMEQLSRDKNLRILCPVFC